jgi:hypothetical protein
VSIRIRLFFDSVNATSTAPTTSPRCGELSERVLLRCFEPLVGGEDVEGMAHRGPGTGHPESQASHVALDRVPFGPKARGRDEVAPPSKRARLQARPRGLTESQHHKSREIPCELSRQNQKYMLCIPTVGINLPLAGRPAGKREAVAV